MYYVLYHHYEHIKRWIIKENPTSGYEAFPISTCLIQSFSHTQIVIIQQAAMELIM